MKHLKLFEDFPNRAATDLEPEPGGGTPISPIGLAVLGAPAGGKGYTKHLLRNLKRMARVVDPEGGAEDLTVDVIRDRIHRMPPGDQLVLF